MILTEEQHNQKEWLEGLGIKERFPFIENSMENETDSIEDIYFRAVLSYETFSPIVEYNHYYSANELRNIKLIQRYQRSMGAFHHNFQRTRKENQEKTVMQREHAEIKNILAKANKVNKGIYFVTGLKAYTSTTLFDNPIIEKGQGHGNSVGCGMYKKIRFFGRIEDVLPETLRLYNGITATFEYPYTIKGETSSSSNIYHVYEMAYKYGNFFEVLESRSMYSRQQKRIIRKLKRMSELNE